MTNEFILINQCLDSVPLLVEDNTRAVRGVPCEQCGHLFGWVERGEWCDDDVGQSGLVDPNISCYCDCMSHHVYTRGNDT